MRLFASAARAPAGRKARKQKALKIDLGDADPALVEKLREWRLEQARAREVAAYVVFSNKTMAALAALRPQNEEELLQVPGIGATKLERFGTELLELISESPQPDA